jgi:hypothetical protein
VDAPLAVKLKTAMMMAGMGNMTNVKATATS